MTWGAWIIGLFQIFFILNIVLTLRKKSRSQENPWEATTLEWAATSPPIAHGNFITEPTVYHGPYEYNVSVNGHKEPYVPQHKKMEIKD
jgi:cytochrome c oxidase subunit 1